MPLDIPAPAAGAIECEPQIAEPQLPDPDSERWQEALRRIFAAEAGIWQRRAGARQPAGARV
jgi:hypothetical protein